MKKESSWDKLKANSKYHFNTEIMDERYDTVFNLGRIESDFTEDVNYVIANSKPSNWETRGYNGPGTTVPSVELEEDELILKRVGMDPKHIICNLGWNLTEKLEHIAEVFGMEKSRSRVHIQMPGQMWNLHLDKISRIAPDKENEIGRYFIMLTDWQMGQFWHFGNYHWSHWKAGDVTTFDWHNVPHSTANAGHHPRITLQLNGVITDKTRTFLEELKKNPLKI